MKAALRKWVPCRCEKPTLDDPATKYRWYCKQCDAYWRWEPDITLKRRIEVTTGHLWWRETHTETSVDIVIGGGWSTPAAAGRWEDA